MRNDAGGQSHRDKALQRMLLALALLRSASIAHANGAKATSDRWKVGHIGALLRAYISPWLLLRLALRIYAAGHLMCVEDRDLSSLRVRMVGRVHSS